MSNKKFWLVAESNADQTHYYGGYYESGKPVFMMAIADAIHIASFGSAKELHKVLDKVLPCEIWIVENHSVTKVL